MSDDKEVMNGVSQKLGIPPLVMEDETPINGISTNPSDFKMLPISKEDQQTEEDFEFSRANIKKLMDDGQMALAHLLRVARAKEDARTYEVVGNMIKNLGELGTRLLELHDQRRAILPVSVEPEPEPETPNNGEFVGTTAQLLAQFHKSKQLIHEQESSSEENSNQKD